LRSPLSISLLSSMRNYYFMLNDICKLLFKKESRYLKMLKGSITIYHYKFIKNGNLLFQTDQHLPEGPTTFF